MNTPSIQQFLHTAIHAFVCQLFIKFTLQTSWYFVSLNMHLSGIKIFSHIPAIPLSHLRKLILYYLISIPYSHFQNCLPNVFLYYLLPNLESNSVLPITVSCFILAGPVNLKILLPFLYDIDSWKSPR